MAKRKATRKRSKKRASKDTARRAKSRVPKSKPKVGRRNNAPVKRKVTTRKQGSSSRRSKVPAKPDKKARKTDRKALPKKPKARAKSSAKKPVGFKLTIKRVKQKSLDSLRKQQKKREVKRLTRKYGKSKRIGKREVPDSPHIIRPKKPKKLKPTSRAIRGLSAKIRTRGQRSGPGKEIYVSAITEFINASGEKTKRTLKAAREAIPEFVEKIRRRYSGRLSLISVSVKFVT